MMKILPMVVLHLSHFFLDYENSGLRDNIAYFWAVHGAIFTIINVKILYSSACDMTFDWFQVEPFLLTILAYTLGYCEPSVVYTVMIYFLSVTSLMLCRLTQVCFCETAKFYNISVLD